MTFSVPPTKDKEVRRSPRMTPLGGGIQRCVFAGGAADSLQTDRLLLHH